MSEPQGSSNTRFIAVVIAFVVIVCGLGITLINKLPSDGNVAAAAVGGVQGANSTAKPTETAAPVAMASPEECPDSRPVYVDPNVDLNNVSGGVKNDSDIRSHMDREPAYLAIAANAYIPNEYPEPPNWKTFVSDDGKCFNTKGLMLRSEIEGALNSQTTKIEENVQIPTDLYNQGMQNGVPVFNPSPGIPEGRVGTKYTQANGTETYVDHHCGNFPKKGVPQGYKPVSFPTPPQQIVPPAPPRIIPPTVQPPCDHCQTPPPPPNRCTSCECNNNCPPPPPPCKYPTPCGCNTPCTPPPPTTTPPPTVWKGPPSEDPAPRGNAPTGGGHNDTNGPGEFLPPTQPPAAPYTPPPAPAPTWVPETQGGPTYAPAQAPPAATQAPETGTTTTTTTGGQTIEVPGSAGGGSAGSAGSGNASDGSNGGMPTQGNGW